jgi:hypothetical protein
MEKRCNMWNTRILCRSGSLKTVTRELARYRFDLVALRGTVEARNAQRIFSGSTWHSGGKERAEDIFFFGCGNENR